MSEKTIGGWLVIDWREETHRTRQSKPSRSELGKHELLADLSIDVNIPDVEVTELALEIEVPEPQVRAATLEALDDEQLPDWTDAANEFIADIPSDRYQSPGDYANAVTVKTLREVNTRPDPDRVYEYVSQTIADTNGGDSA